MRLGRKNFPRHQLCKASSQGEQIVRRWVASIPLRRRVMGGSHLKRVGSPDLEGAFEIKCPKTVILDAQEICRLAISPCPSGRADVGHDTAHVKALCQGPST